MKWEYTKLPEDDLLVPEDMDVYGNNGWELVLIYQGWGIFKRPAEITLATGLTFEDGENTQALASAIERAADRMAKEWLR